MTGYYLLLIYLVLRFNDTSIVDDLCGIANLGNFHKNCLIK
ncbi:hypothetical protein PROVRUST_06388 [Providencia rustigianii DSM 4541]|uniref:Uncharacterized protein n=1 Tax=Providencia rustigianii DSM 4541 TaxID=500637 RepID=D1P2G4_9GAMM|nr:hypothetical protein PROVRUST_06388 [Providencia rustigianii DSM 4541]